MKGRKSGEASIRAALIRAVEVLELCDPDGDRAKHIVAPEDGEVKRLCARVGYGAVMDSASRQWRNFPDEAVALGAFTVGPCVGTVRRVLIDARAALKGYR